MIVRLWRGVARADRADAYVKHLRADTLPHLTSIDGFIDAAILRRPVDAGVEFLVETRWRSRDAIEQFAGSPIEVAVVPDDVQAMMVDYDRTVRHYEVVPVAP